VTDQGGAALEHYEDEKDANVQANAAPSANR
jgi:hypothetical protein